MPPLEAAEWGAGPSAARRPQAWRQRLGTPPAGSHVREPSLRPNPPCPALTAHMLPSLSDTQALSVKWSHLRLPWVDLDWLIDISCQITELDLSANCLSSLPSIIPWGLINLRKLDLSDNHLGELPSVQSSDEIICSRCVPAPRGPPLSPCTRPACSLRSLIQNCQLKKKGEQEAPPAAPPSGARWRRRGLGGGLSGPCPRCSAVALRTQTRVPATPSLGPAHGNQLVGAEARVPGFHPASQGKREGPQRARARSTGRGSTTQVVGRGSSRFLGGVGGRPWGEPRGSWGRQAHHFSEEGVDGTYVPTRPRSLRDLS